MSRRSGGGREEGGRGCNMTLLLGCCCSCCDQLVGSISLSTLRRQSCSQSDIVCAGRLGVISIAWLAHCSRPTLCHPLTLSGRGQPEDRELRRAAEHSERLDAAAPARLALMACDCTPCSSVVACGSCLLRGCGRIWLDLTMCEQAEPSQAEPSCGSLALHCVASPDSSISASTHWRTNNRTRATHNQQRT